MSSPSLSSRMRHLRESRDAYRTAAAKFAFLLTGDEHAAAELLAGAVKLEHKARRDARYCEHESMSGVDRDDTAAKVWRCDACGLLLRGTTENGITVYAEVQG